MNRARSLINSKKQKVNPKAAAPPAQAKDIDPSPQRDPKGKDERKGKGKGRGGKGKGGGAKGGKAKGRWGARGKPQWKTRKVILSKGLGKDTGGAGQTGRQT